MDAFSLDLGTTQERIQPTGWTAPSGQWVMQLGSDAPGITQKLQVGDFNSIAQTADFTDVSYVRVRGYVRPAATMPMGVTWDLVALFDGVEWGRRAVTRELDLSDIALPIGASVVGSGVADHVVEFRLELAGIAGIYDVELPGLYLDNVVCDTDTSVGLCNRDPEPGETGVPLTSSVTFLITDPMGTSLGVDGASLIVTIGGVIAYSGGADQNGFVSSIVQTPDGLGGTVTLTPPVPWSPLETYVVRVQAATNAGSQLDVSYSWTAQDTIAPVVVSALGTDELVVRVSFDETLGAVGSPADYVVTLVSGVPAVTPAVASVALEGVSDVLLTFDIEQTPGAIYQVTVGAGVVDLFGNAVAAPLNVAQWTGYACAGIAGRSFDLYGMLLRSDRLADETGDLRKFVGCYQEVTDRLLCRIDRWVEILDPDTAPEKYLDEMLADLGNPFEFDLTEIDKRRLVQVLVAIYKQKGTDVGIINAVRFFLGLEITITVPWQGGARLGSANVGRTFVLGTGSLATKYTMVLHSPIALTNEQRARIISIAKFMRRAPVHFIIKEPSALPVAPNHWALGRSRIGQNTYLH